MSETEETLGGGITLIGFKLEPIEAVVAKKIVGNYARKLSEKANYKSLKLRLKQHQHGKGFLHEIEAEAVITASRSREEGENIALSAAVSDYNLFSALSAALEKLLAEAGHRTRHAKDIGEQMKAKEQKMKTKFEGAAENA